MRLPGVAVLLVTFALSCAASAAAGDLTITYDKWNAGYGSTSFSIWGPERVPVSVRFVYHGQLVADSGLFTTKPLDPDLEPSTPVVYKWTCADLGSYEAVLVDHRAEPPVIADTLQFAIRPGDCKRALRVESLRPLRVGRDARFRVMDYWHLDDLTGKNASRLRVCMWPPGRRERCSGDWSHYDTVWGPAPKVRGKYRVRVIVVREGRTFVRRFSYTVHRRAKTARPEQPTRPSPAPKPAPQDPTQFECAVGRPAIIGNIRKCLAYGDSCSPSNEAEYRAYGFTCYAYSGGSRLETYP